MNFRTKQEQQHKIISILACGIFILGSVIVYSVAKEGLTYSKASSIHAQSVLP